MSNAGVHSNRGDIYQTYIAFGWTLTVLSNLDFEWIEVDSLSYPVDDVVIGKADGTFLCCQCKKNQPKFNAWTIADLTDELEKTVTLLSNNNNINVRFYSRSPFGAIAKLREHFKTQVDETSYYAGLSTDFQKTDEELEKIIKSQASKLSTFDFLKRTEFETTGEYDSLGMILRERLEFMVNNPQAAYDTLWRHLDQLGGRIISNNSTAAPVKRLTKEDLRAILQKSGIMIASNVNLTVVRNSFAGTSSIGRSWQRKIAGKQIYRPITKELLSAIETGKRSILLTGLPGSGKTCVILELQDELELRLKNNNDLFPLFIQAREFADLMNAEERQAHGLHEHWVERAARLADEVKVVVIIDSLDVLSIAREHNALQYFLAQIDLLLTIHNITVVTSCREFDRQYDRRIAVRQWDCEVKCTPLDWDTEVSPLLSSLDINIGKIDKNTRELILNPRELALFVELAQTRENFNVITSQELAQRYLDTIVRSKESLGEVALQAIERIVSEMINSRSLVISQQRFSASQEIKRELCSLNVLQETQSGKLTFGHQTLLDVLVISGALRKGYTLNEFIQNLPPVPFVRPSIRSFIAQLAIGDRIQYRKQLRAVLTGSAAFHIRRLTAESFAEQVPQDDDWPLLRDLHKKFRDVFHVVYAHGEKIEWHYFWLKYLIPQLLETRNTEGLSIHANRIAKWKDADPEGVIQYWSEVLSLDWFDSIGIIGFLSNHLRDLLPEHLVFAKELVEKLLSMPRQEHTFLGYILARCIEKGIIDDSWLWHYVAGEVSDDEVLNNNLNRKLYCRPHEFGDGNKNFFGHSMKSLPKLLDLALQSIEHWSQILATRYDGNVTTYRNGFLHNCSYIRVHSKTDMHPVDSINVILNSLETTILSHAEAKTSWWQKNRDGLCYSRDGALRYFGILACTKNPEANVELIERILCDKKLLETELSYELGVLINASFIYLNMSVQDKVITCILTLWDGGYETGTINRWLQNQRVRLIVNIPCYLRSPESQALVEVYEKEYGVLICEPEIIFSSGTVGSPFTFEIFLNSSDRGVLQLLTHYTEYIAHYRDFLSGGEREVGSQLCAASSRDPIRFLRLLVTHWVEISEYFCDEIMRGVAKHLSYRYGNLKSETTWLPIGEPDATELASLIIDELERHSEHWRHNHVASEAIKACANVVKDTYNAERLVFITIGFTNIEENEDNQNDLVTSGIDMISNIAEALMILAEGFQEANVAFPELLLPTLYRFAGHKYSATRAVVLQRLPYLLYKNPEIGWIIFQSAIKDAKGLWECAERCLYYTYNNNFEKVSSLLSRIYNEGGIEDMETWGRISALAALTGHIDFSSFLKNIETLNSSKAWLGAAQVCSNNENIKRFKEQCFRGIEACLNITNLYEENITQIIGNIFHVNSMVLLIPERIIRLFFNVLEKNNRKQNNSTYFFSEWLNILSLQDPDLALSGIEIYLNYTKHVNTYMFDHGKNLTQLVTRLFAEAEEREESDQGEMLKRVIAIQDTMLALGVNSINDWLKAAERP
jgi:hypothetical protein